MIAGRWTTSALTHAAALLAATPALAGQDDYRYGPGMMWQGGWAHMAFGSIMMILVVAAIVVIVVVALRWIGGQTHPAASKQPTPLDVLKERFARGDIDVAEYEERRKALGE